jgi:aldose 1-epimerase
MRTIDLHDASSGARAKILADFGFNCYSFTVPMDGEELEVLWAAPGFETGNERPSGSGIPILFPFPGRIKGTQLSWDGQTYELDEGDGLGNAIHGFVHNRPWRIIESSAGRVVGQFQASVDDPMILNSWPADFRITATYELAGTALRTSYEVENPDRRPLPCGLGTHPYFRVPLGGINKDDCEIQVPVSTRWLLDDMIASGQSEPLEESARFRQCLRFADMFFDNIFGGLSLVDGVCTARVCDPSGKTLTMRFNDVFQQCVLYNPPHREAVCIEPYSCVPDPFRLTADGFEVGLRVLEPGESFQAEVEMRID